MFVICVSGEAQKVAMVRALVIFQLSLGIFRQKFSPVFGEHMYIDLPSASGLVCGKVI